MNLSAYKKLTPPDVELGIRIYAQGHQNWCRHYDNYYHDIRSSSDPVNRTLEILNVVRANGWSMNRQGQCQSITEKIHSEVITYSELEHFWNLVDSLSAYTLRNLPPDLMEVIIKLRSQLYEWHNSAATVCFTTKAILMFNTSFSPAFDTKIRKALSISAPDIDSVDLSFAFHKISNWLVEFENTHDVRIEDLASSALKSVYPSMRDIPSGRAFDMMTFGLMEASRTS